jgi:hypothetical protein
MTMPPRGHHTIDPDQARAETELTPEEQRLDELLTAVYGEGLHPIRGCPHCRRMQILQELAP